MTLPDTLQDTARARLEWLKYPIPAGSLLQILLPLQPWQAWTPTLHDETFAAMQRFWQRYGYVEDALRVAFPLRPWDEETTPRGEPSFKWSGTHIESNTRMLRWAEPLILEQALSRLVEQALARLQPTTRP